MQPSLPYLTMASFFGAASQGTRVHMKHSLGSTALRTTGYRFGVCTLLQWDHSPRPAYPWYPGVLWLADLISANCRAKHGQHRVHGYHVTCHLAPHRTGQTQHSAARKTDLAAEVAFRKVARRSKHNIHVSLQAQRNQENEFNFYTHTYTHTKVQYSDM